MHSCQGPSPDESALLEGARRLGFELVARGKAAAKSNGSSNIKRPSTSDLTPSQSTRSVASASIAPKNTGTCGAAEAMIQPITRADNPGVKDVLQLDILGTSVQVQLLNMLEFSSDRKRMSVVMRLPDGKLVAYVKGADSVMIPLLRPDTQRDVLERTQDDMSAFATQVSVLMTYEASWILSLLHMGYVQQMAG